MKKIHRKRHLSNRGFSLVELLVTMLISGIVTVSAVAFLSLGLRFYGNADDESTIQTESQITEMFLTELLQEAKNFKVMDVSSHSDVKYAFEVVRTKSVPSPSPAPTPGASVVEYSSVVAWRGNQLWYAENLEPALSDEEKLDALLGLGVEGAFLAKNVEKIEIHDEGLSNGLVKLDMTFRVNNREYVDTAVIALRNKIRN